MSYLVRQTRLAGRSQPEVATAADRCPDRKGSRHSEHTVWADEL